jgi:hypothetical protein
MPAIVFDLIVVVGVLYLGWLGSAHGLFATAVTLLEVYGATALAILLYEPLAGLLTGFAEEQLAFFLPDGFPFEAWAVFLSFAVLLWGTVAVLWIFVHPKITPPDIPGYPAVDMGGGFLLAAFAGALTIGGALVTWSMCPLLGFLRVPAQHMFFDVGKMTLRAGGRFLGDRHEGRSLPILGEPPSRESVGAARLASEVAYDVDAAGTIEDSDPFFDADGNGVYTKDLYYLDVDGDRRRRIGMAEKYTVARWDSSLTSNERERPTRQPPAAAKPAPVKPAAKPPGEANPPPTAEPPVQEFDEFGAPLSPPSPPAAGKAAPSPPAATKPTPPSDLGDDF